MLISFFFTYCVQNLVKVLLIHSKKFHETLLLVYHVQVTCFFPFILREEDVFLVSLYHKTSFLLDWFWEEGAPLKVMVFLYFFKNVLFEELLVKMVNFITYFRLISSFFIIINNFLNLFIAFCFSKFKKNFEDFLQCSYQLHLLWILTLPTIFWEVASSSFIVQSYCLELNWFQEFWFSFQIQIIGSPASAR